jgi:hypothetical protein
MMMERHEIIGLMAELKLAGMRHAYDEVIADALKRQHPVQHVVGDLLKAEVAEKHARSCCAAIWMRKRDKQDENPVCRDRRRA